ncbi:MAG: RHS repeat domain-containing protein, partial [Bacteroidota bacterium]
VKVDNKIGTREKKTLEEGHVIRYAYRSTGVLHGKLRKVEQIKDGIKRTTRQLGYDELGRLIRETDKLGFTRHFKYDEDGKIEKRTLSKTRDKKVLGELLEKEKSLLAKVNQAVLGEGMDDALVDLGFHYIHEMKEPEKALALLEQVTRPHWIYTLKSHAINYDENASHQQKIDRYLVLLDEYPEHEKSIQFSIDSLNRKIAQNTLL